MNQPITHEIANCPIVFDWRKFKGKFYFGSLNYEKSIAQNRVMIDLHYCATAALCNTLLEKTVPYSSKHFQKQNP